MIQPCNYEQIDREIEYIMRSGRTKVGTIGTTARLLNEFLVLPRRSYEHVDCINFLVSSTEDATYCLERLDGVADCVLIDVEAKQNLDLMHIARQTIRRSQIAAYKPNDASVEAADLLLRDFFQDAISNRSILILGAGNISAKLALRFSERNAKVQIHSRDHNKTLKIAEGLNAILPRHAVNRIEAIERLGTEPGEYDALVSFVAANKHVAESAADLISTKGVAVDGGINNFSSEFLVKCQSRHVACFRLDVRLGFVYSLLSISPDVSNFHQCVKGTRHLDDIRLVAGGVIGQRGDIIVDRIQAPGQIVGVANGIGGVLNKEEYVATDIANLDKAKRYLSES